MPNFVFNNITTTKKVYDAIAIKNKYDNGNEYDSISFKRILPHPKTIEECLEKYGEEYIIKNEDGTIKKEDWFIERYWNEDYWGTKWDAVDAEADIEEDVVYITFSTAWHFPEPFLKKLCEMFPEEKIEGYAEEEAGLFNAFNWENQKGKLVITHEYIDAAFYLDKRNILTFDEYDYDDKPRTIIASGDDIILEDEDGNRMEISREDLLETFFSVTVLKGTQWEETYEHDPERLYPEED